MTTKYEWKIGQLEVAPTQDGLTNVVQSINWSYSASEDDCTVSTQGEISLNEPDKSMFVDFDSLTENDVVNWVKLRMGEALLASYKANLDVLLQEKLAVKTKLVAPPWQTQTV
jgi:hypothetical protein